MMVKLLNLYYAHDHLTLVHISSHSLMIHRRWYPVPELSILISEPLRPCFLKQTRDETLYTHAQIHFLFLPIASQIN